MVGSPGVRERVGDIEGCGVLIAEQSTTISIEQKTASRNPRSTVGTITETADWIIDLGPDGGHAGGRVVAAGSPEQVAKVKSSYTGRFLRECL